jgi:hypothetical protein
MLRTALRAALLCTALSAVGCSDQTHDPWSPRGLTALDGLRLEVSIDRAVIPVGDSAVVTMRLRNTTAVAVRVDFGSGCQIMPYIETSGGALQYPGGGAWACSAMMTRLDVPANGAVTRSIVVRGASSPSGGWPLALTPGSYEAYARLGDTSSGFELRAPTVPFEVR